MTYEKKTYNKPYKKSSRTENAHAYKSKRGKQAFMNCLMILVVG